MRIASGSAEHRALRTLKRGGRPTRAEQYATRQLVRVGLVAGEGSGLEVTAAGDRVLELLDRLGVESADAAR